MAKVAECIPAHGIDFEYCAVKHQETKTFTLSNPTSSVIHYDIKMDGQSNKDFEISPKSGKCMLFYFLFECNYRLRCADFPLKCLLTLLVFIDYRYFESWS